MIARGPAGGHRFAAGVRRLRDDAGGNVMLIFALALPPLLCATGMGVDYANAMRIQTRLSAAADAAALTATSQALMTQTTTVARQRAIDVFKATVGSMDGLALDYANTGQLDVTVTDDTTNGKLRRASVKFAGTSRNSFAAFVGLRTLPVTGAVSSMAKTAPNIDFYVLLDTSGSMALPTTSAGITTMKNATGGCAFACHSTNDATATGKDGKTYDYYGVARSYGLRLRVDEEATATQNMMKEAKASSLANNVTYRMSISRFAEKGNYPGRSFENVFRLDTDLDAAGLAASKVKMLPYYMNHQPEKGRYNGDLDTASSEAFDKVNGIIAAPGKGTGMPGDAPQAVLFVVTDGMRDEFRSNGKPEVEFDTAKCDVIKNRDVRVAILYTEYLRETIDNNDWAKDPNQGNVVNRLPRIETALQRCASDGLFQKVSSDDDISAALNKLFRQAIANSRLTQ